MAPASFVKRVNDHDDRIWEITVPSSGGSKAFYRIAVHPTKEAAFRHAWKAGRTVNLAHYGDIVECGYIPHIETIHPSENV